MDQSIDILIHGTKLGPFLDLNISIWSKSYGQSLLEPIIAELSLLALVFCTNNDIEPNSFNAVAIDARTESEVTKGKLSIFVMIFCLG